MCVFSANGVFEQGGTVDMQSVTPYFVFPHNVATHFAYLSTITSHFIIHTVTPHIVIHLPSLHTPSFTHSHCTPRHSRRVTTHFIFYSQSLHNIFMDSVTTQHVYSLTATTHFVYPAYPQTFTSDCSPIPSPPSTLSSLVFLFVLFLQY